MTYLYELPSDIEPQHPQTREDVLRQIGAMLREVKAASRKDQRLWLLSSEPITAAKTLERIANDAETEAAIIQGLKDYGIRMGKVEQLFPREMLRSGTWERAQ